MWNVLTSKSKFAELLSLKLLAIMGRLKVSS